MEVWPMGPLTAFSIACRPLVPIKPHPSQRIQNGLQRAFNLAFMVCVLNANDEGAAVVAGKELVEQRSADVAHMGLSGRAWSKADSDGVGHREPPQIL